MHHAERNKATNKTIHIDGEKLTPPVINPIAVSAGVNDVGIVGESRDESNR